MASIQLTQVFLELTNPPNPLEPLFVIPGSANLIAINPAHLVGVGSVFTGNGVSIDVRQIYVTGGVISPMYVSDSYATVKAYIDALP